MFRICLPLSLAAAAAVLDKSSELTGGRYITCSARANIVIHARNYDAAAINIYFCEVAGELRFFFPVLSLALNAEVRMNHGARMTVFVERDGRKKIFYKWCSGGIE